MCDNLLGKENVIFLKYESLVLNYYEWLKNFLVAFEFYTLDKHNKIIERFYEKYKDSFQVSSENIYRHKRQIKSGDYKRKLHSSTINRLNEDFSDILDILDYQKSC